MTGRITSRMPRADYDAIDAMNMSRLTEIKRSPLHYRYALTHPKTSAPMTLGIATHVAVLEPERFDTEFAIWAERISNGNMAARKGARWNEFCEEHAGQTILTEDEATLAVEIARAVRGDKNAMVYLSQGEPEVTIEWELLGRPCKGRVDWLATLGGEPVIAGLKSARDCRHYQFGGQAAKLGYYLQWSWYHDGYQLARKYKPSLVEIVVESAAPHAVAVYRIPDEVIEHGREEYMRLLDALAICEKTDEWPGPLADEEFISLPTWAYENPTDNELSDLELIA